MDGSMIVVPLRGREGATGVLTLERLGAGALYTEEEFELVKLFAAQVSIALQNAEVYRAVEIRARTDDLTGLLNHGTFRQWLQDGTARGEPFCLVMIDLDDFKAINDAFGHQAGDRLLRQIGAAIVAAGRENDLVFRYGGDEFAVLAPGTDLAGGMQIARHVLDAIHALHRHSSGRRAAELEVTASIGVAAYPGDATTGESILLAADRACFLAKRTGRNRIASAAEGLAVGEEFSLQEPTPVDPPTLPA
jgi:diguanylate cyclase (GGDEF)-like protein